MPSRCAHERRTEGDGSSSSRSGCLPRCPVPSEHSRRARRTRRRRSARAGHSRHGREPARAARDRAFGDTAGWCPSGSGRACGTSRGGGGTAGRDLGWLVTALHASAFEAIGTTARVVVADPVALPAARALLVHELDELDRAASRFRSDSELVLLNQARGEERRVSPLLLEALSVAVRAAELTDGIVTPMVGRTLRLAGYDTTFALVAGRDGRGFTPQFATVVDWRLLELDEERQTARIPPGVELDLGATAKALAADRAAATIAGADGLRRPRQPRRRHFRGRRGPARRLGNPPRRPSRRDRPTGPALRSRSRAVASPPRAPTARRWRTASGELHHIVDPRTGRPARTPWRTVTVAAATCVDANTASTAALVLGEEAVEWLGQRAAYPRASSPRTARPSAPAAGALRSHDTARGEQCEDALVPHPRHRRRRPAAPDGGPRARNRWHRSLAETAAGRDSSWPTSTSI